MTRIKAVLIRCASVFVLSVYVMSAHGCPLGSSTFRIVLVNNVILDVIEGLTIDGQTIPIPGDIFWPRAANIDVPSSLAGAQEGEIITDSGSRSFSSSTFQMGVGGVDVLVLGDTIEADWFKGIN